MGEARGRGRARVGWCLAAACALAGWAVIGSADARADRIALRGGGQVRGKVLPDPKHADRVTILTERGKTPLSFRKEQIVEVVAERSALDDYLARRQAAPATAAAQYELGLWCETVKLRDLATVHFEAALKDDAGLVAAHEKLGHVKYNDRWLKGDELREAQGLVRDRGRWVTREEKALRDEDRETAAAEAAWARRFRPLRDALVSGPDDRRRESAV